MLRMSEKIIGIVIVLTLIVSLPLLTACGDDEDEDKTPTPTETAQPTPTETIEPTPTETIEPSPTETIEPSPTTAGPTWIHNVTYQDEKTVWTTTVTGEDTVDGVPCYVNETSFDVNPFRYAPNGTPIKMFSLTQYLSKTTLDVEKSISNTEALGMIKLKAEQTVTYAQADHGQPYAFGDKYTYDLFVHLEPGTLAPDYTDTVQVEVVAVEDVMVPAGTFRSYKVEYTKIATNGAAVEPQLLRTEWWAAEYDLLTYVKLVEVAQWDKPETRELVSYETMPAKKYEAPAPTAKPAAEPTPTETVTPTPTPTETVPPPPTETPPVAAASCVGATGVYAVTYDTETTEWTVTVTGEETVDGKTAYKCETAFSAVPARKTWYAALSMWFDVTILEDTTYRDVSTKALLKKTSKTGGPANVTTQTSYTYTGDAGAPLSDGKTWSLVENNVPSMGAPMINNFTVEVAGTETLTVGAGTFECYKVVQTTSDAKKKTEWWDVEGNLCLPVKMMDEVMFEKAEVRELTSYTPAP